MADKLTGSALADLSKELQKPFEGMDIDWRVQQAGVSQKGRPYVMAIPYITNRAVQKRLDDVFGVMGWEDCYKETADGKGFLCGITIHHGNRSVTKWDGAEKTNIEPLKGGLSDSEKRAAVKLGIGRYLYQLDVEFAPCTIVNSRYDADNYHLDKKTGSHISWTSPTLPLWALPFEDYSQFIEPINKCTCLDTLKEKFILAWKAATTAQDADLKDQVTKAKDKRKAYILANIEKIRAKRLSEFDVWLDNEVLTFSDLPTKSTVENFRNKIEENLINRIKGESFESASLFAKLNEKCAVRVNQIESKG
jgi:hypothetical protein